MQQLKNIIECVRWQMNANGSAVGDGGLGIPRKLNECLIFLFSWEGLSYIILYYGNWFIKY
jgi:hypothetical protein